MCTFRAINFTRRRSWSISKRRCKWSWSKVCRKRGQYDIGLKRSRWSDPLRMAVPMSRMNGRVCRVQRARPQEESENDSKYARARVCVVLGRRLFLSFRTCDGGGNRKFNWGLPNLTALTCRRCLHLDECKSKVELVTWLGVSDAGRDYGLETHDLASIGWRKRKDRIKNQVDNSLSCFISKALKTRYFFPEKPDSELLYNTPTFPGKQIE